MDKKNQIAIDIFNNQLSKVDGLTVETRHDFANTLKDYIKQYINPNSEHLESFNAYGIFWSTDNFNKDKTRVKYIITDCITTIQKVGVYKQNISGLNFLSTIDNNTLWAIITFFAVALATGGFYVGKYHERSDLLLNHIKTESNQNITSDTITHIKVDSSIQTK